MNLTGARVSDDATAHGNSTHPEVNDPIIHGAYGTPTGPTRETGLNRSHGSRERGVRYRADSVGVQALLARADIRDATEGPAKEEAPSSNGEFEL